MELDERKLRAFLAVADSGSLGRAAAIANLTQPTLSRLVQDMEARLGQRLFDRHGRGMTLTAAGQALLPHARLLVFEMDATREQLDALRGLRRGTVRIGSVAAIMRTVLPVAVANLLGRSPGLDVDTLEAPEDRLIDALIQREVDLVITSGLHSNEEVQRIGQCDYDDHFAAFCANDHVLPPSPALSRALDERWIMPGTGATPRVQFDALIRAAGHPLPKVAVESTSVEAMIAFVGQSRLLGWLPAPLLAPHLTVGTIRVLDIPALAFHRHFYVYRRRLGIFPDAARELVRALPMRHLSEWSS
jgi:DNA-binding transcriptional LysR family regulator